MDIFFLACSPILHGLSALHPCSLLTLLLTKLPPFPYIAMLFHFFLPWFTLFPLHVLLFVQLVSSFLCTSMNLSSSMILSSAYIYSSPGLSLAFIHLKTYLFSTMCTMLLLGKRGRIRRKSQGWGIGSGGNSMRSLGKVSLSRDVGMTLWRSGRKVFLEEGTETSKPWCGREGNKYGWGVVMTLRVMVRP